MGVIMIIVDFNKIGAFVYIEEFEYIYRCGFIHCETWTCLLNREHSCAFVKTVMSDIVGYLLCTIVDTLCLGGCDLSSVHIQW